MYKDNTIITHIDPKSPESEAYRVLRTNIQFSGIDKPLKTIVITSAGPMEGKTTTVTNLAVTFAQMGSKVLLIDADLRKPRIHKIFLLPNDTGLTNLLASGRDYSRFIRSTAVPNLDVLVSGIIPPNPSELLNSNAMREFIRKASADYDYIFLDAPPVISVTDASIISTYVDGTILVARSGKVERDALKRAKELLDKVNANIIGVVLNYLDKQSGGYYYDYSYYYSEDGSRKRKRREKQNIQVIEDEDDWLD
mgnify:CR=1 FL=1